MKQILILFLFIFFANSSTFGQYKRAKDSLYLDSVLKVNKKKVIPKLPTHFIDENGKAIREITFNKKCNAAVFECKRFDREKMVIFKVTHRMFFGKLKEKEYNQIRLMLNKESNKTIPKNHNILIHYEASLSGFKERNKFCNLINSNTLEENYKTFNTEALNFGEYPFESLKMFKRYVERHRKDFHDEQKFDKEVAEYAEQQNDCIKKIETKYNTPVVYMVKNNYNYPIKNDYFTWVIDKGIIKNTFLKKHPDTDFILLKPNGEYFVKSDFLPDFVLSKLLKSDDWEKQKSNWTKSINTGDSKGYGIVNDMTKEYEYYTSNCY
jgi:hypothetical protein